MTKSHSHRVRVLVLVHMRIKVCFAHLFIRDTKNEIIPVFPCLCLFI